MPLATVSKRSTAPFIPRPRVIQSLGLLEPYSPISGWKIIELALKRPKVITASEGVALMGAFVTITGMRDVKNPQLENIETATRPRRISSFVLSGEWRPL